MGKLSFAILGLIFLLLLLPLLLAQDVGLPAVAGGNLFASGGNFGPLVGIITVGLALASFAIAVLWMAASLLRQGEWESMLKSELWQALATVLLGLFLYGAAALVDNTVRAYMSAPPAGIGPTGGYGGLGLFEVAQGYLSHVNCISNAATIKLEGMKMVAQYFASMTSRFYASAWGISFPTYGGLEVVERALDLVQMFMLPFNASIFVQRMGLDIIHGTAMVFVLPAGILMRLFPPTRDAGAFLIATAFGFYFIFPFTYLIHSEVVEPLFMQDFGTNMCGVSSSSAAFVPDNGAFYMSNAYQLLPKLSQDLLDMPLISRIPGSTGWRPGGLTKMWSYVAFQAVFLPSLSMVMTVSFIRMSLKFFSQKME